MAKNFLKISKEKYTGQLNSLQNLLGKLDATITSYETKRNEMDKFIEDGDDHYQAIREGIDQNIKICRKYREMTDTSIKSLREILNSFDDFGDSARELIDTAKNEAGTIAKAAIEVANLLD